ncbi:MAG: hypothetical protein IPN51_12995 [Chloracidobacterium sp.]|nr:hypothetical protein [Chloracidobacterium sp.]
MNLSRLHRRNILASFFVGIVLLVFSGWSLSNAFLFYCYSTPTQAKIIEVFYEKVPRGRGSAMAYVPMVELTEFNTSTRVKVDTNNDSPIYSVGSFMNLRCISNSGIECREFEGVTVWLPAIIALLGAVAFIGLGFFFRWKEQKED